ncbi:hypothetical protein D3C72_2079010 [compost metagenome]
MARDLPQHRGKHRAAQRMPPGQPADRHHHVDRRQHQDLAEEPEQVKERGGKPVERPVMAQYFHVPFANGDQPARDDRHQQQPQAQHRDIAVRQHRRDQEVPAPDRNAMDEDH